MIQTEKIAVQNRELQAPTVEAVVQTSKHESEAVAGEGRRNSNRLGTPLNRQQFIDGEGV